MEGTTLLDGMNLSQATKITLVTVATNNVKKLAPVVLTLSDFPALFESVVFLGTKEGVAVVAVVVGLVVVVVVVVVVVTSSS